MKWNPYRSDKYYNYKVCPSCKACCVLSFYGPIWNTCLVCPNCLVVSNAGCLLGPYNSTEYYPIVYLDKNNEVYRVPESFKYLLEPERDEYIRNGPITECTMYCLCEEYGHCITFDCNCAQKCSDFNNRRLKRDFVRKLFNNDIAGIIEMFLLT
jgi:hypothetical protein